ncbi:MAG TPA: type II toxin-antitoxin system death-on-curing family toxin [Verrucomicrobiae bacterium]|nr:type II toxin-antitoxin system death-on-curing family toxin [Verrucomicrobiae bacterium]
MSADPLFLTRAQVERLHSMSLERFGGSEGIRDEGLIQSALASAINARVYGNGDVFDVAAAYAFHLAEAQAFIDGNKRTAAAAALTFLDINGIGELPGDDVLYDAMIAIANKEMSKTELAALFRAAGHSK